MKYCLILLVMFNSIALTYDQIDKNDSLSIMNSNSYLINDSLGNIWIGYKDIVQNTASVPKVALWDGQKLKIYNGDDNLPYGVVRDILIKKDGSVVFATDKGFRIFNQNLSSFKDFDLPQNEDGFRKIAPNESNQGNQMLENNNGGIWCLTKLFEKEDIYSEKGKIGVSGSAEIWKFENEIWSKVEFIDLFNTDKIELVNFDENRILIYGLDFSNDGISLPALINTNDNSISNFNAKEFTNGDVTTIIGEAFSYDGNVLFSYELPSTSSILYEGFSIYDLNMEKWTHYGAEPYLDYDSNFEFIPIPSAYDIQNDTKFPQTNWIRTIRKSKSDGFWLGMFKDYSEDWLEQKGGGLLHFDGGDNFIKYSVPSVDEIKPLRLSPDLERASDQIERSEVNNDYMSGIAYDKNGDLWFGSLFGGIWIIPKYLLPDKVSSVERKEKKLHDKLLKTSYYDINGNIIYIQNLKAGKKFLEVKEFKSGKIKVRKLIK